MSSSPVHLQSPAPVPDRVGMQSMHRRETGLRRIFVQTDAGRVLDIEVDRDDRVQTIKKKLQATLCLPTEQSSLVFGDIVLENDFTEVRNDSPVLLTRVLCRTSSTPCLSPVGVKDRKRPLEIIGGSHGCPMVKLMVRRCMKSLHDGIGPLPAGGGLGGAYCIPDAFGNKIAIIKPTDEEPFAPNNPNGFVGKTLGQPGLTRSIRVGETGYREVAAYLLDHGHFAHVPPTALVKATHSIFNVNSNPLPCNKSKKPFGKIGSLQRFEMNDYDASEHGTSRFPVEAVHRIGILDIRILNTDRHGGNILVRKLNQNEQHEIDNAGLEEKFDAQFYDSVELIPIDHGLCLPEALDDPYFEWQHWSQASLPFSEDELEYIRNLNAATDADLLRKELPMLRESCLRVMMIATMFLQKGAEAGLSLAEIGGMMSRDFGGMDDEPSQLENICIQAKKDACLRLSSMKATPISSSSTKENNQEKSSKAGLPPRPVRNIPSKNDSETPKRINCITEEENDFSGSKKRTSSCESETDDNRALKNMMGNNAIRTSCRVSSSTNKWPHASFEARTIGGGRCTSSPELTTRKARDMDTGVLDLDISGMNEEEWSMFYDCFQQILPTTFANLKASLVSRLGSSCRF